MAEGNNPLEIRTGGVGAAGSSVTEVLTVGETEQPKEDSRLVLKLKKPEKKKVNFTSETVDNEHMNKKKSKRCCIYKKPRAFGDSSSDSDSDDDCHDHGCENKRKADGPPECPPPVPPV